MVLDPLWTLDDWVVSGAFWLFGLLGTLDSLGALAMSGLLRWIGSLKENGSLCGLGALFHVGVLAFMTRFRGAGFYRATAFIGRQLSSFPNIS